MSNNVSVNSSALGVFVCRLLLFRKSVRIVVLFINKIEKKRKRDRKQRFCKESMKKGIRSGMEQSHRHVYP